MFAFNISTKLDFKSFYFIDGHRVWSLSVLNFTEFFHFLMINFNKNIMRNGLNEI